MLTVAEGVFRVVANYGVRAGVVSNSYYDGVIEFVLVFYFDGVAALELRDRRVIIAVVFAVVTRVLRLVEL